MIDEKVAICKFCERYKEYSKEEKVDNSKLYAGSPMYFYCHGCTKHVATLPEDYITSPPRYCESCRVLVDNGLLDKALREANVA